jgi:hypothetical protein
MLRDLERRARRLPVAERRHLSFIHGDMRSTRLDRRFELVIAPFNTILHLYERADVERFLAGVRAHLAPGASFVFDYSIPIAADLVEDPEIWRDGPPIRVPGNPRPVGYRERFDYDVLSQVLLVEMAFVPPGRAAWSTLLSHRQFFPREMEALLYYNGFSEIRFTADFTRNAPAPDVDSLVVEARGAQLATQRRRP